MNFKQQLVPRFSDIRFWIILFFIVRLYGITFPPLEVGHNWRQTDGLMIARNFYEVDATIFYPRVDSAGDQSGIVGCEFPMLNYLIYLVSLIFGYTHWYGRIIVLIFSSFGVFFFFKLIQKYFNEQAAFNASIVLLVSLWFSYSRKNIPDVFAASLCIMSLYFAFNYLESGKWRSFFLFFILGLVGCLSKILAATILTALLIPVLDGAILLKRKVMLSVASLIILLGVLYWYFVWVPHLNSYGFGEHFFMGTSWREGLNQIMNEWPRVLKRFYSTPLKYSGFIVFMISIVLVVRQRLMLPLVVFILPFISFVILLVKTGSSIVGDHYYIITVIPAMAFILGYGLTLIRNKKIVTFLLIVIGVECIAGQIYDFRIRQPFRALADLENIMDQVSSRNELIAINGDSPHNPTPMYFAHRKGWVTPNSALQDSAYVKEIKDKGCKFIVIAKESYGDILLNYPIVHDSEYFKIYSLKSINQPL